MRHQPQIALWDIWVEDLFFKRWVVQTQNGYPERQKGWGLRFGQSHA